MNIDPTMTLAELGELRLIEEVILPLARECDLDTLVGDDCAYISCEGVLAVTADVGPKPLLQSLQGYDRDLDAAGWLAVVATASDVATAGAEPLFLTNCIDAPPDLTVGEFKQFLGGYFEACASFGFKNGGGDVRHGQTLTARVFGAGICRHGRRLGRSGVHLGDRIAVVGPAGEFMATYLLAFHGDASAVADGMLTPSASAILRRPRPQLNAMQALVAAGVVTAASDTSDGLIGAVDNLCRSSGVGVHFELTDNMLTPALRGAAKAHSVDPWNIFVAWGDWSVVVAVPAEMEGDFGRVCLAHGISWHMLGTVTSRPREITATVNTGRPVIVNPIRNENFVSRGFNAGLSGHLRYILSTPLFSKP